MATRTVTVSSRLAETTSFCQHACMMSALLPILLFALVTGIVVAGSPFLIRRLMLGSFAPKLSAAARPVSQIDLPQTDRDVEHLGCESARHVVPAIVWMMLHIVLLFLCPWAAASGDRLLGRGAIGSVLLFVGVTVIGILYVRRNTTLVVDGKKNNS